MWRLVFILFLLPAVSWGAGSTWKSNSSPGYAQPSPGRVNLNPLPPGPLADLLQGRTYNPDVTEGSVLLRDLLKKTPGPKGASDLGIVLERKATGKALATAMARGLPIVGTALAVADVLDAAGCKISTTTVIECTDPAAKEIPPNSTIVYVVRDIGWSPVPAEGLTPQLNRIKKRWEFGKYKCTLRPYTLLPGNNPSDVTIVTFDCAEEPGSDPQCAGGPNGTHCAPASPSLGVSPTGPFTAACLPPNVDIDGQCTRTSNPTPDEFGERASNDPEARPKLPGLAPPLDAGGIDYDTEGPPKVTGPSVFPGGREETKQNPDGSTTTRDRDYPAEYPGPNDDPWYEWDQRDTSKTWPPGVTPDPYVPGGGTTPPPGGSSSSTTTKVEVKTCGLPGTPPCKIDESGTPSWDKGAPETLVPGVFAGLMACIASPLSCLPTLPSINWAFSLPTSCSVIPLPAFAPFVTQVDVCQFQSVIHDLMSLLWVAAGLFGAVTMVYRDSTGGA
jgi:hypothetical protein